VLYSFTGSADGANPSYGVITDSEGNLYGTTEWGGKGGFSDLMFSGGGGRCTRSRSSRVPSSARRRRAPAETLLATPKHPAGFSVRCRCRWPWRQLSSILRLGPLRCFNLAHPDLIFTSFQPVSKISNQASVNQNHLAKPAIIQTAVQANRTNQTKTNQTKTDQTKPTKPKPAR
jgi:hypothetical protein